MTELQRATEIAYNFDELSQKEFGSSIVAPEFQKIVLPSEALLTRTHPAVPDAKLVPLAANFDRLTKMTGSIMGILINKGSELAIYPGLITSRSTPENIHFTYLDDPIHPQHIKRGLTPLQQTMLNGSLDIQDKSVGSSHSHDTVKKVATELGHTTMAVRALSDDSVMQSITQGKHIAHDWSHNEAGIASIVTERDGATKPGMFDFTTRDGARKIDFQSATLHCNSEAMFVEAESFTAEPTEPEFNESKLIVVGIGLLAAQQRLGNATQDKMLRAMDTM